MLKAHLAMALRAIRTNANRHAQNDQRPDFHMLAEECLELSMALREQHEHPAWLELIQIGGIVANWLADIMQAQGDADIVIYTRQHEQAIAELAERRMRLREGA